MMQARKEQPLQANQSNQGLFAGYKGGEEMPLAGYAKLLGIYNAALAGFVFKPRTTRFICGLFWAVTVSDFLQHTYNAVKEKK
jgi:hypothetical protein